MTAMLFSLGLRTKEPELRLETGTASRATGSGSIATDDVSRRQLAGLF